MRAHMLLLPTIECIKYENEMGMMWSTANPSSFILLFVKIYTAFDLRHSC